MMTSRRRSSIHLALLAVFCAACALSAVCVPAQPVQAQPTPAPAVALQFPDLPVQARPGNVSFDLQFQKPAEIEESRLVFLFEARRASDHSLVASGVNDNSGHGHKGASGLIRATLPIPADFTGEVYFTARAVPWSLNRAVCAWYEAYPRDGTYTYAWKSGSYGVTQDIYYLGTLIAPAPGDNTTYCSGLTFETFTLSYLQYSQAWGDGKIGSLTSSQLKNFRLVWYGVTDADHLSGRAISDYGLGEEITDWEEVQRGDFVQIWRRSGSGHSVVFVNWVRGTDNEITGFRYWSTQTSTNGIGYQTEYFGETSGVNRSRFWPARIRKPRDAADVEWTLGLADTSATPTRIASVAGNALFMR